VSAVHSLSVKGSVEIEEFSPFMTAGEICHVEVTNHLQLMGAICCKASKLFFKLIWARDCD
jgi:hypothetical protein